MRRTESRVLILDPDFEHVGGHNHVTNQILAGRLRSPVQIACAVTLPASVALEGATLCRVFPRNSYVLEERRSPLQKLVAKMRAHNPVVAQQTAERAAFANTIASQLDGMDASAQDCIVVHTGSCFLFEALLDALETRPAAHWPALHLRQLRPIADPQRAGLIHQRLRDCRRNTDVFFYAETDAFMAQLERLGHRTCDMEKLEISDIRRPVSASPAIGQFVEVAVLGTVRREKGHGRLEAVGRAYQELSRRKPLPVLKFSIHTGAIKNGKLFKRTLQSLDRSRIDYSVHEQPQDVAGHWRCLEQSHIVLVPYEPDRYRDRGSGVCIDAVAHARPLIVSEKCTLEEYLRDGNGLCAESPEDFARCIAEIAERHVTYAEASLRLAKEFRATQQAHPLFDRLGV